MSNHSAVVAILLPRMNIMCIEDALMYVIDKENIKVRYTGLEKVRKV